ncbi:MAG TPA: ATP-binding protein [Blastocatellia bacterium]|nr:ATP-binding protein [Blastocatellia bacterium]
MSTVLPVIWAGVIVAVLIWQVFNLRAAAHWVDHTDQVIAQANDAEKNLLLMQSELQEYLLTRREDVLDSYKETTAPLDVSFGQLEAMVSDNRVQLQRVHTIRSLHSLWSAAADTAIGLKQTGRNPQAGIGAWTGNGYMGSIQSEFISLVGEESRLRAARSAQTHRDTVTIVIAGISLTLLLGAVIASFIRRQLQDVSRIYGQAIVRLEQATSAVKQSEQQYRLLFENNPLPMWVFDSETLKFLGVNEAAIEHYGYSRDEFRTMTINDIRPEEDVSRLNRSMTRPGGGSGRTREWRHRKKDGSIIDVEVTSDVIDFEGVPAKLVCSIDITERKQAEREIIAVNQELEQRVAERTVKLVDANKELEAFSYTISHDLRAPLRAIDGFSRILLEDFESELAEEPKEHLQVIRENAQRMGELIDDLLAFSRLGRKPLQKRRLSPGEIVKSALEDLQVERNGHSMRINVSDLPECEADPVLLRQVFTNLLSNAMKYSRRRDVPEIEVGCLNNGMSASHTYFVRDNGVGFDMKYSHKLFGVFQRLHLAEEFEGTGVGLAIVQRIVHSHGGKVWAEAEPDKGACFYFTIPGGDAGD